jgi:hypothetical protein
MIDVKQAVSAAAASLESIYEQPVADLLLEEVERSEDGRYWLITLGFSKPLPAQANQLQQLSAQLRPPQRIYKLIKIDAATGEFVSMKIREAQAA